MIDNAVPADEKKVYRYRQVYLELKEDILSGTFPYESLLPSERAICERFSVWRATARQALDMLCEEGFIEKRAGVGAFVIYRKPEDVIPEPAKTDRSPKKIIGFFATDAAHKDMRISQPYYYDLISSLEEQCYKNGFMLLYSSVQTKEDMLEILHRNNLAFAVFLSHTNFSCIDAAVEQGVPCALVHETYNNCTVISCDHENSGYLAIKHLAEYGHTRIGLIGGHPNYFSTQQKIVGCLRACNELNIPFPYSHLLFGNWEYEGGYNCAKKMLSSPNPPTALFVFNDIMCFGAMHAIRELGYSIPDDISIIGSDNMKQLQITEPDLTTIDTGVNLTAQVIVSCAKNGFPPTGLSGLKLLTPVSLKQRNSVRKI